MIVKASKKFDINYIDPSSISEFNRCPAKYMLNRLEGLHKPERTMMAADYGTDIHEAVPYCYNLDTMNIGMDIFKKNWEARAYPYDKKRNVERAEITLANFARTHSTNCPYDILDIPIAAPTTQKISKNEVPFLVDIGGKLSLAGRIDAPVRWKSDGSLWSLDYKTSQEVSQRLFSNFENCPQVLAYTLALSIITGERCKGMIIEAIRVSDKNAESEMQLIFVQDHHIKDFIAFANDTAERMLECNEKQEWPMRCSNCSSYSSFGFAGYTCDFLNICNAPVHEDMYKFYTKSEPFHPFTMTSDIGE
jgi:hypothetical protein